MPTNVELMQQIDADITDKTTSSSISPTDVGENMKNIIMYVDQETDAEVEARNLAIEAAQVNPLIPAGSYNSASGSFPTSPAQGGSIGAFYLFQASSTGTMTGTGSLSVNAGEFFYSLVENPGQVAANYAKLTTVFGAATTSIPGIVELATNSETTAGTDTQRAVTPAGLTAALGSINALPVVKVQKTDITSSQILNSGTTPITVLSAPISGKSRFPIQILVKRKTGNPYSNVSCGIVNGLGAAVAGINASVLTSAAAVQNISTTSSQTNTGSDASATNAYDNQFYQFKNLSGNPTSGTGDITVYITYIEITL